MNLNLMYALMWLGFLLVDFRAAFFPGSLSIIFSLVGGLLFGFCGTTLFLKARENEVPPWTGDEVKP